MAKIFKASEDADVKQLDFFSTPPTNTSVKDKRYLVVHPVSGITSNTTVLHFQIKANTLHYLDLWNTLLWARIKIRDGDGNIPTAEDNVWVVNHILRTLWKQVEVYIGGKLVTPGTNNYHYKACMGAYLYDLDTYGKKAQMGTELFYEDTPGAHDSLDGDPTNQGTVTRQGLMGGGESCELEGRLGEDVMAIKKLVLNGVPVDIKLYLNRMPVVVMSDDAVKGWRVEIEDAYLKACVADVGSAIVSAQGQSLERGIRAQYFFKQAILNNYTMAQGQRNFSQTIFQGKVPQRIVVAMVSSDRYTGDYRLNPFYFDHFYVSNMSILVNDVSTPGRPMEMNFRKRQYATALNSVQRVNPNILINQESFDKGYALFVFDINPNMNEDELPLQKTGTVRLEMQFDRALPEAVQVLAYGEFLSCIQIDNTRAVQYTPL